MTKPSWQDFGTHDESIVPELWDGVIGAWAPCLGPTGSRLHDMSRRANWGTLTNMVNATDWMIDSGQYAMNFDGADNRVNVGSGVSFLGPRTLVAWMKMTSAAVRGGIFGTRVGGSGWVLRTSTNSTLAAYHTGVGATIEGSPNAISSNQWHMVGYSFQPNSGALNLFVNAVRIGGTTGYAESILGSAGWIGDEDGTSPFPAGQMDTVTLWNRELNLSEHRLLYQLGRGGMYQRRRRSRIYISQAGFQAAWARRQSQIIGGGL